MNALKELYDTRRILNTTKEGMSEEKQCRLRAEGARDTYKAARDTAKDQITDLLAKLRLKEFESTAANQTIGDLRQQLETTREKTAMLENLIDLIRHQINAPLGEPQRPASPSPSAGRRSVSMDTGDRNRLEEDWPTDTSEAIAHDADLSGSPDSGPVDEADNNSSSVTPEDSTERGAESHDESAQQGAQSELDTPSSDSPAGKRKCDEPDHEAETARKRCQYS